MKRIIILVCLFANWLGKAEYSCLSPTEYLMEFLAKSGTKWRNSTDWINKLESMGVTSQIDTVYVQAEGYPQYKGVMAAAPSLMKTFNLMPCDDIRADFTIIKYNDDKFEIVSKIRDTHKTQNGTVDVGLPVEKAQFNDDLTRCNRILQIKKDRGEIELLVDCLTRCSLEELKGLMKQKRNS